MADLTSETSPNNSEQTHRQLALEAFTPSAIKQQLDEKPAFYSIFGTAGPAAGASGYVFGNLGAREVLSDFLSHPGLVLKAENFPGVSEAMRYKQIGLGLATVIGVGVADTLIDRQLFSDKKPGGWTSFADYIVTPVTAFVPGNWLVKGGIMVAAHLAGRLLDAQAPESVSEP